MGLIYLLFGLHFFLKLIYRKKPVNIFTLMNVILLVSYLDFFIIREFNYENNDILIITFIFTYISAYFFDVFFKYERLEIQNKKTSKYFWYLYALVVTFRVFSFVAGSLYGTHSGTKLEVTSFSNVLGILNNSGIYFYITAVVLKNKKKTASTGIIEALWYLISGSKLFIVFVALIYFFNEYQYKKIKKRVLIYITVSIVILPYIFLVATNFRISAVSGNELNYDDVKDILFLENQIISELKDNQILERFSTAYYYDKFVSYSTRNPNNQFSSGEHFLITFLWFVPRALWKDKPSVSYGSWVGSEIYGWETDSRSEAAPTLWGDFYNSFGIYGVFFGILLFHSFLYILFSKILKNTFFKALFTLSILTRLLFIYEQNFSSSLVFIMMSIFITYIFQRILINDVYLRYNNI